MKLVSLATFLTLVPENWDSDTLFQRKHLRERATQLSEGETDLSSPCGNRLESEDNRALQRNKVCIGIEQATVAAGSAGGPTSSTKSLTN